MSVWQGKQPLGGWHEAGPSEGQYPKQNVQTGWCAINSDDHDWLLNEKLQILICVVKYCIPAPYGTCTLEDKIGRLHWNDHVDPLHI